MFRYTGENKILKETSEMEQRRSASLRKGRFFQQGGIYHLRFSVKNRQPVFDFQQGRKLAKILVLQASRHQIDILTWVIMPDHIHLLVQLNHLLNVSDFIRQVKSDYTRSSSVESVWQDGFFDRAIRTEDNIKTVARYIVANPIRAGLVNNVSEYSLWDAVWL